MRDEKKTTAKAGLGLDLCERIFVVAPFSFLSQRRTHLALDYRFSLRRKKIQMNLTADLKTRRFEAQNLS